MAIRIIEGKPGSGKTYYAVNHLAKTFFKEDGLGILSLVKDVTLITNIDGFTPKHIDLVTLVKDAGGVSKFFSYDYQDKFRVGKSKIVYIIDEAQRLFRKSDKTLTDVFSWFEYHRHWGQDIYLVTQNSKKLPFDITTLVEYVIRARPRSRSLTGAFKYGWYSDSEIMNKESLAPNDKVFALYKSMDTEETEKVKNPMIKTIGLTFVGVAVLLGIFYWYFSNAWAGTKDIKNEGEKVIQTVDVKHGENMQFVVAGSNTTKEKPVKYKLNHISEYRGKRTRVSFIFDDQIIPLELFDHPVKNVRGTYYALLLPSEIPVRLEMERKEI